MNLKRNPLILVAFWICIFQASLAQIQFHPDRVKFFKDTTGVAILKEEALKQVVKDSNQAAILRFLELEIESGNAFDAISTLEDWQKKDGGTAQGLYLLGTAYGWKGNIKRAFMAMEQAYRRNPKLGNNTLGQEIQFLRIKANPLGRPERVNGIFSQNSLEHVRKSQSNPKQVAAWNNSRQRLYAWLQERAWVYQKDSLWISWMCMDMGELSYVLNEPEIAKIWYKEAVEINPDLADYVDFRLALIQPKNAEKPYFWMAGALIMVVLGLWLYFRSQRQVENAGKQPKNEF
jgi:tetratricopeptide (TPR) repeat protein